MGFLSVVKGIIFRNEIAADVSADNEFEKLVEWWGLVQKSRGRLQKPHILPV